jgi:hypothetical protein
VEYDGESDMQARIWSQFMRKNADQSFTYTFLRTLVKDSDGIESLI